MVENTKKRKRSSHNVNPVRGVIDANWQKLLASALMLGNATQKPSEENKEQYTGIFRRGRKKQSTSHPTAIDNKPCNESSSSQSAPKPKPQQDRNRTKTITKFIAMDCEMVGIGASGEDHMVARVSLVNKFGDCIYDKFVKPREEVMDYRTKISGVRKEDLLNGETFATVQKEVSELLKGRVLVGHSLTNDLRVLFLSHPKRNIRDTAKYKPFRKIANNSTPSLKRLAKELLSIDIQGGEHSSVEDAKAVMQLYCMVAKDWEQVMNQKRGGRVYKED